MSSSFEVVLIFVKTSKLASVAAATHHYDINLHAMMSVD
jgi:hypothetical protein